MRSAAFQLCYVSSAAIAVMGLNCPRPAVPSDGNIVTVAGDGGAGFTGDGLAATATSLDSPMEVIVRPSGQIVIADFGNNRVRSIDAGTHLISTIAGDGTSTGAAALVQPTGVAFLSDGSFVVAAWGENRIYRYASNGTRSIVAGGAVGPCGPDFDQSAGSTAIQFPRSVASLPDDEVFFSEQGCHRIRRIAADVLSTLAGTGDAGYTGDDGPASEATFSALLDGTTPCLGLGLSPEDPPDELYVADTANHVIREINLLTGRIETFAGTGQPGFADGPPDQATFRNPTNVFTSHDHSVWVVDTGNHAIRRIDSLGLAVETVAGTGQPGFSGDGGPPREAQLNHPSGVFVTEDGDVFIADTGNHRVRLFQKP